MKNNVIALAFFSLVAVGCSNAGKENLKKVKTVRVGMTPSEVKNIMGIPKDSSTYYNLTYRYEAPFGYSDDIRIVFDTNTLRVRIINEGH